MNETSCCVQGAEVYDFSLRGKHFQHFQVSRTDTTGRRRKVTDRGKERQREKRQEEERDSAECLRVAECVVCFLFFSAQNDEGQSVCMCVEEGEGEGGCVSAGCCKV